jgi:hypothetical protein
MPKKISNPPTAAERKAKYLADNDSVQMQVYVERANAGWFFSVQQAAITLGVHLSKTAIIDGCIRYCRTKVSLRGIVAFLIDGKK